MAQRIGRHGSVIGMRPAFVGFHDLGPFLQIIGKAGAGRLVETRTAMRRHHHQRGTGRCAPPLLWRCQQDIDACFLKIDEDRAAGDTVQNEYPAMLMHTVGHGADEIIRHHHPGRRFDMGAEDNIGLFGADALQDILQRVRCERRVGAVVGLACGEDGGVACQLAGLHDLAPAIAEPAIANHQHACVIGELAGNRLHAICSASGNNRHRGRAIGIAHDP